jgi:hypothetical protein
MVSKLGLAMWVFAVVLAAGPLSPVAGPAVADVNTSTDCDLYDVDLGDGDVTVCAHVPTGVPVTPP